MNNIFSSGSPSGSAITFSVRLLGKLRTKLVSTFILGLLLILTLAGCNGNQEVLGPSDSGEVLGPSDSGEVLGPSDLGEVLGPSDSGEVLGPSDLGEVLGPSDLGEVLGPSDSGEVLGPSDLGEVLGPSDLGEVLGPSDLGEVVTVITTTPCYNGPGPQYGQHSSLKPGVVTPLIGAGFTGDGNDDWIVTRHPTAANTTCWIPSKDVTPSIPYSEMRLINVPGLPTPTPKPPSDRAPDEATPACYYDPNNALICP